jgi:hypothetical protein
MVARIVAMHNARANLLALQKGFRLLEAQNGTACQLVDRYLGFPVLNPRTQTIHFTIEEALDYLQGLPDRPIAGSSGHW